MATCVTVPCKHGVPVCCAPVPTASRRWGGGASTRRGNEPQALLFDPGSKHEPQALLFDPGSKHEPQALLFDPGSKHYVRAYNSVIFFSMLAY